MIEASQTPAEQPSQYLPAGPPDPLLFEDFDGMNTATLRPGVDDKQAAWLDGFMPLGPRRNLRTMYGIAAALYTTPANTIVAFDTGNLSSTPVMLVFISDGSIVAVNTATGNANIIAAAGTIQNPSRSNIGFAQYGSKQFLIVAKQTNGYFIWDGTTFSGPGVNGVPLGIGGTAIEIYSGRVWIANGPTITFSVPGSVLDFSSGNGGGNFTSSDSFLRVGFTQLKQTNGFLYLIADSSVNYISGVQTSGSPPVTTFTNQNADPESGSPWPGTVSVFNRNILFANSFGAQVSYGGAVTKISEALDGIYNTATNFGNIVPSASKAIVFGKKIWILLLPIIDPISGQQVNKLLMTRDPVGKIWWAAQQDVSLVYINFQEINSVLTAWGTDGKSVYQLFAQPSTAVQKIAQTKLWDKPGGYQLSKFITRVWGIFKYYNSASPVVSISLDNESSSVGSTANAVPNAAIWTTALGAISIWTTTLGAVSTWISGGTTAYSVFSPTSVGQNGALIGFTVTTNIADMAIVSMMIDGKVAGYRG